MLSFSTLSDWILSLFRNIFADSDEDDDGDIFKPVVRRRDAEKRVETPEKRAISEREQVTGTGTNKGQSLVNNVRTSIFVTNTPAYPFGTFLRIPRFYFFQARTKVPICSRSRSLRKP